MENLDRQLFEFINSTIANPVFDFIFPSITDFHKNPWFLTIVVPLMLGMWIYRKRWKMVPVLLGLIVTVVATDNFNYRILKPAFKRERPVAAESNVIQRSHVNGGNSFPSNHAANNFAGATFLSFCYPAFAGIYFAVASLIAFSRVYVGVHYPGDVLGGALVGIVFGLFFYKILAIILKRGLL